MMFLSAPTLPEHRFLKYLDYDPRYSSGPAHSFMGFLSKLLACIDKRFKAARGGSAAEDGADDGSDTHGLFFQLRALQIATNYFSELNRLGHGGFGPVYKGLMPNGPEKMLVYEYLPNKSLDYFIFDKSKSPSLDWGTRFKIISGIARGTHGYMAPEYAMHGYLSVKTDVFSYGVVVLEIVSGRKNHDNRLGSEKADLLNYSWLLFQGRKSLDLVDPSLEEYNPDEAAMCIQLGLLCCQQTVAERPDMNSVNLMLSSDSFTLPRPGKPAIQGRVGRWTTTSTSAFTNTNASSTNTGVTKASAGSSFVEDYSRNSMSYSSIDEGR
ncbi:hypothetical protein V6N11_036526 [Hibiscus sabdariffa]|uniref:Serine-threonine/tyrosine-protein kinase catalytic domain-containing protein n=1 Tax=Hibiscus sabdariffa TaxID=183260 RepID=A0ABR2RAN3_9ROSI